MASMTITTPVGPFTIVAHGDAVVAAGFTDVLPEPVRERLQSLENRMPVRSHRWTKGLLATALALTE